MVSKRKLISTTSLIALTLAFATSDLEAARKKGRGGASPTRALDSSESSTTPTRRRAPGAAAATPEPVDEDDAAAAAAAPEPVDPAAAAASPVAAPVPEPVDEDAAAAAATPATPAAAPVPEPVEPAAAAASPVAAPPAMPVAATGTAKRTGKAPTPVAAAAAASKPTPIPVAATSKAPAVAAAAAAPAVEPAAATSTSKAPAAAASAVESSLDLKGFRKVFSLPPVTTDKAFEAGLVALFKNAPDEINARVENLHRVLNAPRWNKVPPVDKSRLEVMRTILQIPGHEIGKIESMNDLVEACFPGVSRADYAALVLTLISSNSPTRHDYDNLQHYSDGVLGQGKMGDDLAARMLLALKERGLLGSEEYVRSVANIFSKTDPGFTSAARVLTMLQRPDAELALVLGLFGENGLVKVLSQKQGAVLRDKALVANLATLELIQKRLSEVAEIDPLATPQFAPHLDKFMAALFLPDNAANAAAFRATFSTLDTCRVALMEKLNALAPFREDMGDDANNLSEISDLTLTRLDSKAAKDVVLEQWMRVKGHSNFMHDPELLGQFRGWMIELFGETFRGSPLLPATVVETVGHLSDVAGRLALTSDNGKLTPQGVAFFKQLFAVPVQEGNAISFKFGGRDVTYTDGDLVMGSGPALTAYKRTDALVQWGALKIDLSSPVAEILKKLKATPGVLNVALFDNGNSGVNPLESTMARLEALVVAYARLGNLKDSADAREVLFRNYLQLAPVDFELYLQQIELIYNSISLENMGRFATNAFAISPQELAARLWNIRNIMNDYPQIAAAGIAEQFALIGLSIPLEEFTKRVLTTVSFIESLQDQALEALEKEMRLEFFKAASEEEIKARFAMKLSADPHVNNLDAVKQSVAHIKNPVLRHWHIVRSLMANFYAGANQEGRLASLGSFPSLAAMSEDTLYAMLPHLLSVSDADFDQYLEIARALDTSIKNLEEGEGSVAGASASVAAAELEDEPEDALSYAAFLTLFDPAEARARVDAGLKKLTEKFDFLKQAFNPMSFLQYDSKALATLSTKNLAEVLDQVKPRARVHAPVSVTLTPTNSVVERAGSLVARNVAAPTVLLNTPNFPVVPGEKVTVNYDIAVETGGLVVACGTASHTLAVGHHVGVLEFIVPATGVVQTSLIVRNNPILKTGETRFIVSSAEIAGSSNALTAVERGAVKATITERLNGKEVVMLPSRGNSTVGLLNLPDVVSARIPVVADDILSLEGLLTVHQGLVSVGIQFNGKGQGPEASTESGAGVNRQFWSAGTQLFGVGTHKVSVHLQAPERSSTAAFAFWNGGDVKAPAAYTIHDLGMDVVAAAGGSASASSAGGSAAAGAAADADDGASEDEVL